MDPVKRKRMMIAVAGGAVLALVVLLSRRGGDDGGGSGTVDPTSNPAAPETGAVEGPGPSSFADNGAGFGTLATALSDSVGAVATSNEDLASSFATLQGSVDALPASIAAAVLANNRDPGTPSQAPGALGTTGSTATPPRAKPKPAHHRKPKPKAKAAPHRREKPKRNAHPKNPPRHRDSPSQRRQHDPPPHKAPHRKKKTHR